MRKSYMLFPPTLTTVLFATILFYACKKEANSEQLNEHNNVGLSIHEAKNWYSQQLQTRNKSIVNDFRKIKNFTALWTAAKTASDNKFDVVELPVQLEQSPGFSIRSNKQKNVPINGVTKLLILKNKETDEMETALMHIYDESGLIDKDISYLTRSNKFSGFIFYTTLVGEFVNGWKYENGKVVRKSSSVKSSKPIASLARDYYEGCQTVETN